ncbi:MULTISPECIES: hypothetical protein [Bradyrhizobium]|jgi:hypothetical protein|uniref:Uncharacterized protein n=2 Tax=Bradyrhizobium TaxID=374 RepID=A0A810CS38_9BRAD|nr:MULTISPECIES: hypothetical protein [Bradyrhizobium]BCE22135.1 hypothetical protein XF1B_48160 [Bradyrhizobium diazoefficiens]MBP1297059.1 hypothetical protein [Bradyrhizobium elkanii]MCS3881099.1 hypothetical protein [Bradyrhizobium elkanii]MCS4219843.1 hypothetical protein [Bradyrhizobium elkanii]QOZ17927.1 hypothetical protein XI02_25035 [Bradyrhizobium sp. CCBAU 21365]
MRLIYEPTGQELKPGDKVPTFRKEMVTVQSFNERRVYCKDDRGNVNEWFHSVIHSRVVDP